MEHNYFLKDGLLYKLSGSSAYRVSIDDVLNDNNRAGLIIDDTYFFYVGMEHISTSAKKINAIAQNYLNVLFPSDMVKYFGVFQNNSKTIIYIINDSLIDIIENNKELFAVFKKISTPFLELCMKYNEFIFSDGIKKYMLSENMVSLSDNNSNEFITAKDLFDTLESIKYSITLPGIVKKSALNLPFAAPAAAILIIYIFFIIGSISQISANNKVNKYYEESLQKIYNNMGVASSKDPYGLLIQQSKSVSGGGSSQSILSVLNDLNSAYIDGVTFEGLNIRDNDIRVTGIATDFAKVEEIKKLMENKLQKSINVDDTKKTKDGITFTMKYDKGM